MGTEKRRIDTQMPRRTKVRSTTVMASEWDIGTGSPSSGLKTPANKMRPAATSDQHSADNSSTPLKKSTNSPHS